MGTIIEFPAGRRVGSSGGVTPRADMGTILILPVIRIEREARYIEDAERTAALQFEAFVYRLAKKVGRSPKHGQICHHNLRLGTAA